jgi:hypothetical protein
METFTDLANMTYHFFFSSNSSRPARIVLISKLCQCPGRPGQNLLKCRNAEKVSQGENNSDRCVRILNVVLSRFLQMNIVIHAFINSYIVIHAQAISYLFQLEIRLRKSLYIIKLLISGYLVSISRLFDSISLSIISKGHFKITYDRG